MNYEKYLALINALEELKFSLRVNHESFDDDLEETWNKVLKDKNNLILLLKEIKEI